jgi:hypothetical protein
MQIEHQFSKKAIVERLVLLHLDFHKKDKLRRGILRRKKNPINPKTRFFDFDGFKSIPWQVWAPAQVKEQTWKAQKELVENNVSFHKEFRKDLYSNPK